LGKKSNLQFTKEDIARARARLGIKPKSPKLTKVSKEVLGKTFAARLEKTVNKINKRQADNMALFRAEQKRQGKKADEPIDLMAMMRGK